MFTIITSEIYPFIISLLLVMAFSFLLKEVPYIFLVSLGYVVVVVV